MNRFARFDTPDITICSFRANSGDSQPRGYRLVLFFEWACHIKNVDILGGTPTWDLDVPVHPIVTNYAGGPMKLSFEVEPSLAQ